MPQPYDSLPLGRRASIPGSRQPGIVYGKKTGKRYALPVSPQARASMSMSGQYQDTLPVQFGTLPSAKRRQGYIHPKDLRKIVEGSVAGKNTNPALKLKNPALKIGTYRGAPPAPPKLNAFGHPPGTRSPVLQDLRQPENSMLDLHLSQMVPDPRLLPPDGRLTVDGKTTMDAVPVSQGGTLTPQNADIASEHSAPEDSMAAGRRYAHLKGPGGNRLSIESPFRRRGQRPGVTPESESDVLSRMARTRTAPVRDAVKAIEDRGLVRSPEDVTKQREMNEAADARHQYMKFGGGMTQDLMAQPGGSDSLRGSSNNMPVGSRPTIAGNAEKMEGYGLGQGPGYADRDRSAMQQGGMPDFGPVEDDGYRFPGRGATPGVRFDATRFRNRQEQIDSLNKRVAEHNAIADEDGVVSGRWGTRTMDTNPRSPTYGDVKVVGTGQIGPSVPSEARSFLAGRLDTDPADGPSRHGQDLYTAEGRRYRKMINEAKEPRRQAMLAGETYTDPHTGAVTDYGKFNEYRKRQAEGPTEDNMTMARRLRMRRAQEDPRLDMQTRTSMARRSIDRDDRFDRDMSIREREAESRLVDAELRQKQERQAAGRNRGAADREAEALRLDQVRELSPHTGMPMGTPNERYRGVMAIVSSPSMNADDKKLILEKDFGITDYATYDEFLKESGWAPPLSAIDSEGTIAFGGAGGNAGTSTLDWFEWDKTRQQRERTNRQVQDLYR